MKKDRLTPGLILLVIGVFLLLKNLGYLPAIKWSNIIHLWPIFLVIGGINLIFANNRTVWASILKITVTVAGIALILLGHFGDNYSFFPEFNIENNSDSTDTDTDADTTNAKGLVQVSGSSFYHVPLNSNVKAAKLEISGGGSEFKLSDTTAQLFTADVNGKGNRSRYQMESSMQDSTAVIDFKMKGHHQNFNWNSHGNEKDNVITYKLNSAPLWDLKLNAGGTALDFDLAKFKVRNFTINGGAASFKVKFAAPIVSDTNIEVSSGVSDIKIMVPKDAACSIVSTTGLSSNTFDGFNKTSDNHYQTPNFNTAKKRIYINISGGMSDFSVERY